MKRRQDELEARLQTQIRETEALQKSKEREMRQRSLLDEKLLKTIPLVNEANAISDELSKKMLFGVKLMANPHKRSKKLAEVAVGEGEGEEETKGEEQEGARKDDELDTEVFVRIEFVDKSRPVTMWCAPHTRSWARAHRGTRTRAAAQALRQVHEPAVPHARDVPGVR